jgi:UDP-glucuronate 4-epimerase
MKKVLITGAAGFICANLMSNLRSAGYDTLGVDSYTSYYAPSMKVSRTIALDIQSDISAIDISDGKSFEGIVNKFKPDQIIHLAAQGGVRASQTDPDPYLISNQLGFLNVLRIAEDRTELPFIYASSSSVYGDSLNAPFSENQELCEPKSLYALSKISNELIAKHLPGNGNTRIGLRFFTVYGPWGRPDMAMFRLLASKKLNTSFNLTADLEVKRDFTFVDDVSEYIVSLLNKNSFPNVHEIFNVGGGNPYTLSELLKILNDQKYLPLIAHKEPNKLDVRMTNASVKKSEDFELRIPTTALKDGVEKSIEWIENIDNKDLHGWYQ